MTETNAADNISIVQAQPTVPVIEKPSYSNTESIFALICMAMGYLFIKLILVTNFGISTAIYFALFTLITFIYFKKNNIKSTKINVIFLGIISIFNINFVLSSNIFIKFLNILFIIATIIYWSYSACNENKSLIIKNRFFEDLIKAVFVMPFKSYGDCTRAINYGANKHKFSKNVKLILIGLCFAIPITAVVAGLLFDADTMFKKMLSSVFDNFSEDALIFVLQAGLGIPIAFYLFGMLIGNARKKNQDILTDMACERISSGFKIAPSALIYASVTPICVLYLLFFVSQSAYFLSAFKSYLPKGFSYAEYARQGFFELFTVAIINLGIIIFINAICKINEDKKPLGLKIYTIIISIFTIMLIATALSKMIMYINNFGFTLLRIYTSWFMILLAVIFILIIIKVFNKNINFFKYAIISFIILFSLLNFSDVDGIVAKYNVMWYQSGKLEDIDINMMYELSDSVVQYVLPLTKSNDSNVKRDAFAFIRNFDENYENQDLRNFNFSTYIAEKKVNDSGIFMLPD